MSLNKTFLLVGALLLSLSGWATPDLRDTNYTTIAKIEVTEHSSDKGIISPYDNDQLYTPVGVGDRIDNAGRVVSIGRDIVALGQDIYNLVIKGKPTNTTKYDPISVIPKADGKPVDVLESTENWKMPLKRSFTVTYKNLYGMSVCVFRYSVMFSYGGQYNGKGAYITAAQVVPESVKTMFGFDFTATMKLGGIQNQGTRDNPIAAATLLMEYNLSSVMKTETSVDSYFITGRGGLRRL